MTEIPRRISLVDQVADILRRAITSGEWAELLPGEHELCERFQVSRITLRTALGTLEREGLITASQGQRRRVVSKSSRAAPRRPTKVIGFVSALPLHQMSSLSLYLIGELQHHLHDAGFGFALHAHSQYGGARMEQALGELLRQTRADAWVVCGGTPEMERCFLERRVPALEIGSPPVQGRTIPTFGVDYRAVCSHAVGRFVARGHRRLAMLLPGPKRIEDEPTRRGFEDGLAAGRRHPNLQGRVVYHDGSMRGIVGALRDLFRAPHPPTALLVVRPRHVLTVVTELMNTGHRIPGDVSVVTTGYEPFLENLSPPVAHYEIEWSLLARKLYRLIMALAASGRLARHETTLMPVFREGGTLAAPGGERPSPGVDVPK